MKTRELRSDESTFVWTTLLFSLGKGLNYFLFLFNIVLFLVAIARFESPFVRHFKAIRSCACFVRSTSLCKFEDDENCWKTLWSGETRSVARK